MKVETQVRCDECMSCGNKEDLTAHHAIPRRMNPNYNATVTVCRTCHDLIHSDDVEGLKGMLYKGQRMLRNAYAAISNFNINSALNKIKNR